MSIDKFRSNNSAKINCIELYNETNVQVEKFNVTAYQRLDADVPSEVMKRSDEEIDNYAKFYDVYNCVLVFGAVNWKDGEMVFNFKDGEEGFKRELEALKQLIARRSNQNHNVKIICTTLADGAGGNGHVGVNEFMGQHWERVADQMLTFMRKYDLDGMDIDWEYPRTKKDWNCFNQFITKLDNGMKEYKADAILSGALSSSQLGMSKDVLERFDQIQYMAYDGRDKDGYQSSLEQAQIGLKDFIKKGAKLSQINIGIAMYGRPLNNAPYWPTWGDLKDNNLYWNNKFYNVECGGELFDAAYCSPALAGDKATYALLTGAGGVMVFRLGCDKTMDDDNSVTRGIDNALKRYINNY